MWLWHTHLLIMDPCLSLSRGEFEVKVSSFAGKESGNKLYIIMRLNTYTMLLNKIYLIGLYFYYSVLGCGEKIY